MKTIRYLLLLCVVFIQSWEAPADDTAAIPAGSARVDISPTTPVQLINVSDQPESTEIEQKLYARAIAIGSDEDIVVLIGFDGIGVPAPLAELVATDLKKRHDFLSRERIAICATHTHWAPHLKDLLGNIYGGPLPTDRQDRADQYTDFLRKQLVEVAAQAVRKRKPSRVSWTHSGKVTFAVNRRMEEGGELIRDEEKGLMITWNPNAPTDHTMPLVAVRDFDSGKLSALLFNYACHNVAISGTTALSRFPNASHGDWAGLAQDEFEKRHPGAIAIATIGCAGDQRPDFCGGEAVAMSHAREICDEADRLLSRTDDWVSLSGAAKTKIVKTDLPLEPAPDSAQLKSLSDSKAGNRSQIARSFVARSLLRRIEQGKQPPQSVPFIAQSWKFPDGGPEFVFLSGEVCIDYQLRAKQKHGQNLWVTAYANATPCYIVSKRMLEKGGYEAGSSMFYYGWLRPLKPEAEDLVMKAIDESLENEE